MRISIKDNITYKELNWGWKDAYILAIEINRDGLRDGVEVGDIDIDRIRDKDVRLILDNGHWCHGWQFVKLNEEK